MSKEHKMFGLNFTAPVPISTLVEMPSAPVPISTLVEMPSAPVPISTLVEMPSAPVPIYQREYRCLVHQFLYQRE